MTTYFFQFRSLTAILLLAIVLSGCEVETYAYGTVTNSLTGDPIVGAHIVQLAISKNKAEIVSETDTDSTGHFSMGSAGQGFGARKVNLQITVEKDSFETVHLDNNNMELNIQLTPY